MKPYYGDHFSVVRCLEVLALDAMRTLGPFVCCPLGEAGPEIRTHVELYRGFVAAAPMVGGSGPSRDEVFSGLIHTLRRDHPRLWLWIREIGSVEFDRNPWDVYQDVMMAAERDFRRDGGRSVIQACPEFIFEQFNRFCGWTRPAEFSQIEMDSLSPYDKAATIRMNEGDEACKWIPWLDTIELWYSDIGFRRFWMLVRGLFSPEELDALEQAAKRDWRVTAPFPIRDLTVPEELDLSGYPQN